MSDDDDRSEDAKRVAKVSAEEVAVALGGAAGAAAGAVVGPLGVVAGGAAGAGITRMGISAWDSMLSGWGKKRRRRFCEELDRLIDAAEVPDAGDDRREEFEKTLFQSYFRLMNTPSDAAVRPLARLVSLYRDGRRTDEFFRSVGRVLETVDDNALVVLSRATKQLEIYAHAIAEADPSEAQEEVCFEFAAYPDETPCIDMAWPHHWQFGQRQSLPIRDPAANRWGPTFAVMAREGVVQRTEAQMIYDAPPLCYVTPATRQAGLGT